MPKINKGYLQAINGYIHNLAENQFWDDQIYKTLAGNRHHKMFTQEVFWLRLLELLRLGKDQEAKDWIYLHSHDEQSWHLELEVQIWRVVQYRLQGQWVNDTTPVVSLDDTAMHYDSTFDEERKRHPFFTQLNDIIAQRMEGKQIDIAGDMQKLLDSEQVFSALFFAAGWKEAAPRLSLDHQQTQGFPLWYQDALQQLHQEDPKG